MMSLLTAARPLMDKTVEVLRYPMLSMGIDKNTPDWQAVPTVTATVQGSLQPASTEAQERAGLIVKAGRYTVFCEPIDVTPATYRLRIAGKLYAVLGVAAWPGHSEIVVGEV